MWSYAVDMYEKRKMFEEAIVICKNYASDRDTVERAKRWDEVLGEQQLIKLLKKMNLTDSLIDYLCEKGKFDEAFKIAKSSKHKLIDVHLSYAMYLEDEKRYKEAEENYLNANKYDQVVNMYLDIKDYHSALSVATQYDQSLLPSIYIQHGKESFNEGDFEKMEACFINARKPEMAVDYYMKNGNFNEAMRVAKKHCPHLIAEISNGIDNVGLNLEGLSGYELVQQARVFEENRDWERALDIYLTVTVDHFDNNNELEKIWDKAVQLAFNFVKNKYYEVVKIICKRLREISSFEMAGDYYDSVDMIEEAVKCYLSANNFDKAKNCLKQMNDTQKGNELLNLIEVSFKKYLQSKGDAEQLVGNQAVREGLELMVQRGDWMQALTIANSKDKDLLNVYILKFLNYSLKLGKINEAVSTLSKFGIPQESQNLPIYRQLIKETLNLRDQKEINNLKAILVDFIEKFDHQKFGGDVKDEFSRYLFVSHILKQQEIYKQHKLSDLSKLSTLSLMRYLDLLSMDKPFYDAGVVLKEQNNETQAFMFFNRYLDIYDYIEDPDNNFLDDSEEFKKTDFYPIDKLNPPSQNAISDSERNQIRDWLLQISVKRSTDLKLETRCCSNCSQKIYFNSIKCPFCNFEESTCHLTGSPILKEEIRNCKHCNVSFKESSLSLYCKHFNHCPWCEKKL